MSLLNCLFVCASSLVRIVSRARILGNAEIFVKSGSDINLTCVAQHSPEPPSFIYWYKEGRVINYSQRGGISVLTERKTRTSKLVISKAMASDSGNYTCFPSSSGKIFPFFSPFLSPAPRNTVQQMFYFRNCYLISNGIFDWIVDRRTFEATQTIRNIL